ncbi:MAG: hypothetical protein M3327_01915 [Actinomycetota bacterium]|nr:hypothetical protein [Actinomycetota bacterium]
MVRSETRWILVPLVAALVAASALIFGAGFASEGHVETEGEAEHSARASGHEEGGDRADEADGGNRPLKIGSAALLAGAGSALIPLALLLPPGRRKNGASRLGDSIGEPVVREQPSAVRSVEEILRPALALFSVSAAIIHFVVIPEHWREWWGYGLFFVAVAVAQLLFVLLILYWPLRELYLVAAAGNAVVIAMWVLTRTYGSPLGPEAGEREALALADVVATVLEALLVAGSLAAARALTGWPGASSRPAYTWSSMLAVVVTAVTATSILSLVEL